MATMFDVPLCLALKQEKIGQNTPTLTFYWLLMRKTENYVNLLSIPLPMLN